MDATSLDVLAMIYQIVKEEPQPLACPCKPRELILRMLLDWTVIVEAVKVLELAEMVSTVQKDTMEICITQKGLEALQGMSVPQ